MRGDVLIHDHERPCQICGNGAEAHFGGRLGHPMPPPPWKDTGREISEFGWPRRDRLVRPEELVNRGLGGRLRWLVTGR